MGSVLLDFGGYECYMCIYVLTLPNPKLSYSCCLLMLKIGIMVKCFLHHSCLTQEVVSYSLHLINTHTYSSSQVKVIMVIIFSAVLKKVCVINSNYHY